MRRKQNNKSLVTGKIELCINKLLNCSTMYMYNAYLYFGIPSCKPLFVVQKNYFCLSTFNII